MGRYIKICSGCGRKNEVNSDKCSCGESMLMVIPMEEENDDEGLCLAAKEDSTEDKAEKKFRRCKVCGAKNYLVSGKDVRKCRNPDCLNDELYRSRIETEHREESGDEVELESDDKIVMKLIAKGTSHVLNISSRGAILGKMGTEYADFFSDYEYVSRIHCEIKFVDGYWVVKDISTNSTRKNGNILPKKEFVPLENGDLLSLANVHFEVEL